jgi:predicted nucleic acid-binding protein
MAILLDTNILLRLLQPHHPHCSTAERAIDVLRGRNELLNIVPQNLIELWAVATRPYDLNGLGLTTEQATKELEQIQRLWRLVPEVPLLEEWTRLVTTYRVSGKHAHDAHIVAAMRQHGIGTILTFNASDFARYTEINVIDPAALT